MKKTLIIITLLIMSQSCMYISSDEYKRVLMEERTLTQSERKIYLAKYYEMEIKDKSAWDALKPHEQHDICMKAAGVVCEKSKK